MDMFMQMIPFLFVLAVVYGALDFSGVFNKNSVKGIISLAIALFALTSQFVIDFIYGVLPYAVILFIVVFFLAFLAKLFGGRKKEGEKGGERDWSLIVIVVILVLIFLASQGTDLVSTFLPSMPVENLMYGVGLVLILLIFYAVYQAQKSEK